MLHRVQAFWLLVSSPPKTTSRIWICVLGDVCWPFQALILMYANQPFSAEKSGLLSCLDTPPLFSCWIFPITLCRQFWNIAQNVFSKTLSKMFQWNLLCCLLQKVVRGGGGPALAKNFDNRKFWLVDTNASSSLPSSKICNF